MLVFKAKGDLKSYLDPFLEKKDKIGFVPTMGALHQGHLSLVENSKQENDLTVVSIFVNPTQFDNSEDLVNYPKTLDADLELLKMAGCDVVYVPTANDVYSNKVISQSFDFDGLENEMEGKFRNGHFDGVGTIVKTFFEIIKPTNAYFGEKDFQQLQIVRKMVEKEHLQVNVIGCPIYREDDGLAMSSRNLRLSENHRKAAGFIYKTLLGSKEYFSNHSTLETENWVRNQFENHPLFELEYYSIADETSLKSLVDKSNSSYPRAFIAVYADSIRLIDNISLIS